MDLLVIQQSQVAQPLLHVKQNWVETSLSKIQQRQEHPGSGSVNKATLRLGLWTRKIYRLFTTLHVLLPFVFNARKTMMKVLSVWTHACVGKHRQLKWSKKTLIHVRMEGCQQRSNTTLSPSALSPIPTPSASLVLRKSGGEVSAQPVDWHPTSELCKLHQEVKALPLSSTVKVD